MLSIALSLYACAGEPESPVSSPTPTPEVTASASPAGAEVYSAEIAVGEGPGYLTIGSGSVWVGNHPGYSISRIDPQTNAVDQTIEIDGEPTGMLHAFGDVWTFAAITGLLHRIDGATGEVTARIQLEGEGGSINGLAEGAGSLWVSETSGNLYRVDPATDKVVSTIRVLRGGCEPGANIAFGNDAVWYACWDDEIVWMIDAASGSVSERIDVGGMAGSPHFADGSLWVPVMDEGVIVRLDAGTHEEIGSVRVGTQVEQVVIAGDDIWVRVDDQELARVDLHSGQVLDTFELPASPVPGGGLAVGFGSVWVVNFGEATVWRLEP